MTLISVSFKHFFTFLSPSPLPPTVFLSLLHPPPLPSHANAATVDIFIHKTGKIFYFAGHDDAQMLEDFFNDKTMLLKPE